MIDVLTSLQTEMQRDFIPVTSIHELAAMLIINVAVRLGLTRWLLGKTFQKVRDINFTDLSCSERMSSLQISPEVHWGLIQRKSKSLIWCTDWTVDAQHGMINTTNVHAVHCSLLIPNKWVNLILQVSSALMIKYISLCSYWDTSLKKPIQPWRTDPRSSWNTSMSAIEVLWSC